MVGYGYILSLATTGGRMSKLIIYNNTDLDMDEVLPYILSVIRQGRISNDNTQYCYHTVFKDGITVTSKLNKSSDTLTVDRDE